MALARSLPLWAQQQVVVPGYLRKTWEEGSRGQRETRGGLVSQAGLCLVADTMFSSHSCLLSAPGSAAIRSVWGDSGLLVNLSPCQIVWAWN